MVSSAAASNLNWYANPQLLSFLLLTPSLYGKFPVAMVLTHRSLPPSGWIFSTFLSVSIPVIFCELERHDSRTASSFRDYIPNDVVYSSGYGVISVMSSDFNQVLLLIHRWHQLQNSGVLICSNSIVFWFHQSLHFWTGSLQLVLGAWATITGSGLVWHLPAVQLSTSGIFQTGIYLKISTAVGFVMNYLRWHIGIFWIP